jgi:hypothetical protein
MKLQPFHESAYAAFPVKRICVAWLFPKALAYGAALAHVAFCEGEGELFNVIF